MIIAYMFVLHFIADFVFQSREMGQKKSSEFKWLAFHLAIQTAFFVAGLSIVIAPLIALKIALLNSLVHGVIDWHIWRGYKFLVAKRLYDVGNGKLGHSLVSDPGYLGEGGGQWRYWEDHMFYTTIGFDQLLHGLTIIALARYFL